MRFLSQYPSYGIQIRPQKVRPLGDGTSQVIQEPLYIKFVPADEGGMIYEKEQYEASKRFNFHGSQQHQDEATPVDTIHRLGIFDTVEQAERHGWTVEELAEVERVLMLKTHTTPNAVIVMDEAPLTAPFPAYDDWSRDGESLVLKLAEDGYDLAEVLYYERSQFGPRRPEIIEALEIGVKALEELQIHA
jgi:hypothetical protein